MKKLQKPVAILLSLLLLLGANFLVASAQTAPLNYVVLGDSIGWGSGLLNPEEACYGRIVANTNGYHYINYAENGERSQNLLSKLQRSDVAAAVAAADIISISIGGNDFLRGNFMQLLLLGYIHQYQNFDAIGAEYRTNFPQIIETILALNPDVQILMQTLYNPGNILVRSVYQQAAKRINNCIFDYLGAHPGAYEIVDVAAAFGGNITYIAADTIHPNAKGNVKIAELTLQKLHELGLGENTTPVILQEGIDQIPLSASSILGYFRIIFKLMRRAFS